MADIKIALVGAGSFVFGPSLLSQIFLEERLDGVELALIDPDGETAQLMAGVGRRMAREQGLKATITSHASREGALAGANFVVNSASVQMRRRFAMDRDIIHKNISAHLITEFGGIAGISYSLRQIAFIEGLAEDMRRECPEAWLLSVSNPLPRVAQAAHESGIRTAGFCSVSLSAYGMVSRILTGEPCYYPYEKVRERWKLNCAGVNHLVWVTELRDRATEEDLLPQLRKKLRDGATSGNPRSDRMSLDTGYLLAPADDHTRDFFAPQAGDPRQEGEPWHGGEEERQQRLVALREIGDGNRAWDELLVHEAWEKPGQFIRAMARGGPSTLHSLNLVNDKGQIPELPANAFVETPCMVQANGPAPEKTPLPPSVSPYCALTALVTDTIVRAALTHKRSLVHAAVELDPTVLDKAAGIAAIDACLEAHTDLLPTYS
jgi:alpha-galactosidase